MAGFEWIKEEEIKELSECLSNRFMYAYGHDDVRTRYYVHELEDLINKKYNTNCIAVNSGTSAIFVAIKSLNLPIGSEIITTSHTFVATIEAIKMNNMIPVFADLDETNLCLDANSIESLITDKTKIILPVHMWGHPVNNMNKIKELCVKYNLYLIEDAAQCINNKIDDNYVGTIGDFGILSFGPIKTVTSGEGGIILIKNKEHFNYIEAITNHGYSHYELNGGNYTLGNNFNFRMSEINGALGKIQFNKIDNIIREQVNNRTLIVNKISNISNLVEILEPTNDIGYSIILKFINKEVADKFIKIFYEYKHKIKLNSNSLNNDFWSKVDDRYFNAKHWNCNYKENNDLLSRCLYHLISLDYSDINVFITITILSLRKLNQL